MAKVSELYLKAARRASANFSVNRSDLGDVKVDDSGRNRVAPHIKTYIRHGEQSIDWALLTSANLSKQAWGEAVNSSGDVRIASWEIGVLVWPELLAESSVMVGTFQTDTPSKSQADAAGDSKSVVGLRMAYSMPLQGYGKSDDPWVGTKDYSEPDLFGRTW